ncbi:hypothetical protein QO012_004577 [Methylobacterium aerolatum]|uniref:von willebrand factor type a n=2 Tax=Methylobacterium aerolatum TaxID=418708 RepID=A0ABU0I605_9HYPH|nr:hypothetical protein [Methylobacterium aerolatum]GJD37546.1 hypothetical protein FMGBMHLM_4480 [Methylobacterium aerolatum]
MLMFGGAAIDYGLATRLETKLRAATDSTALLLCQTPMTISTVDLNILAQTTMAGAMGVQNLLVEPLIITNNPRKITLVAHKQSSVFFGKLTGTTFMNPRAKSECASPLPKTFEIALVLDNTGSMGASSGGQTKLQAVQQASTNFVNYVYNNSSFSSATKISIVPFAAAVAVDPSAYRYASWIDQNGQSSLHWTNVLSPRGSNFTNRFDIFSKLKAANNGWDWAGCLETLPYPLNVQDGAPTGTNKDSYYVPLFAPDEPGAANKNYAEFTVNNNKYYSFNSYIDDDNGSNLGSCPVQPAGTSFNSAEGRACKYVSPANPAPTNSGAYTGIPNGPNFGCTTRPLQRLTNDKAALKALINAMAPSGSTNIHEGFMWGWRTLSPTSVFADGSAYSSSSNSSSAQTINKIIILMTDGTNSWATNPYSPNGSMYFAAGYFKNANDTTASGRMPTGNQNVYDSTSARNALDALTAEACKNAKNANISIYTIGFSVPSDPIDSAGQTLLRNCASTPAQFYIANNSDDLIKSFQQIQASIGVLRLTQ